MAIASAKGLLAGTMLAAAMMAFGAGPASAASPEECERYARAYADRHASGAEDVLGGAASGAIGGAIIGGIVKGKKGLGPGAGIGAGIGALGGAARSSQRWQAVFDDAYDRCMARGADYGGGAPEPWTPEWYDYCSDKYRSFDPETGTYTTYSGKKRFCQ